MTASAILSVFSASVDGTLANQGAPRGQSGAVFARFCGAYGLGSMLVHQQPTNLDGTLSRSWPCGYTAARDSARAWVLGLVKCFTSPFHYQNRHIRATRGADA